MRIKFHDSWLPTVLSAPLGLLAVPCVSAACRLTWLPGRVIEESGKVGAALEAGGVRGLAVVMAVFYGVVAVLALAGFAVGLTRRAAALALVRKAYILGYLAFWLYAFAVHRVTAILDAAGSDLAGAPIDSVSLFFMRWDAVKWYALGAAGLVAVHVVSWTRRAINRYTGATATEPAPGDRVIENIRSHGADPAYRKSWWSSVGSHVAILILLPWLFEMIGCVEPYRIPKGSGDPVVAMVKIVKPKKQKKKQYVLRPDSAIYFHVPDLDDSKVLQEVDQATEMVYRADPNAKAGKMGRGGGKQGGWPEGMEDGKIRFIRLKHDGPGWDDGMDRVANADMNFLEEFHRLTGFQIARKPEAHPIGYLAKYDKGFAPPFVYLTGTGQIPASRADLAALKDYLNDGGMLFADAGSPGFDRFFRVFIGQALPGQRLIPIAHDDPIFQFPYAFPNGAPPLWHHGGNDALGIKHRDRWIVFYHPGDVNDAWKTGHSGMRPDLAEGAMNLGVNILYYSFTHYLEQTRKYRK